jgi:transcriptional antiterminator NusG
MKRWYVLQVFAGYEDIVKADIEKRIQETQLQEAFGQILVPSAKMKQFFDVADALKDQQLFPGYVLVEMDATRPEAVRLVVTCPRIVRFLGGKDPVPLSAREIDRVLAQMRGEVVLPTAQRDFAVREEVEINAGPFAGFMGIIDKIDNENKRLTVMVSIFGRMTPVELGFDQVKH